MNAKRRNVALEKQQPYCPVCIWAIATPANYGASVSASGDPAQWFDVTCANCKWNGKARFYMPQQKGAR